MPVTLPQYLVLIGELIPRVGLVRRTGNSARTEAHLAREKVHGGILHGNQEEGCEEEKETLTVLRDDTRKEPRDFTKGLRREAPLRGLFDCTPLVADS
jgi:hypothetical protein